MFHLLFPRILKESKFSFCYSTFIGEKEWVFIHASKPTSCGLVSQNHFAGSAIIETTKNDGEEFLVGGIGWRTSQDF